MSACPLAHSSHVVAPCGANVPLTHAVHGVAGSLSRSASPDAQMKHEADPAAEYVPDGHATQPDDVEYCPELHCEHAVFDAVEHIVLTYCPEPQVEHKVQLEPPVEPWYRPPAQTMHDDCPAEPWYCPLLHASQSESPCALYLPVGQSLQCVAPVATPVPSLSELELVAK